MESIFEKTEKTVVSLLRGMLKSMDEDLKDSWSAFRDLLISHEEFDAIRNEQVFKDALVLLCECVDNIERGVAETYTFDKYLTNAFCHTEQIKITDRLIEYINKINDKDLALDGDYPEEMHMLGGMLRLIRTLQGCLVRTDKFNEH
ncbi:MAG TPA: hypothetical protein VK508_01655 [Cyclobacteriaceae bacterium]|nr:hypothetical protein [Cyclobacteriaceae bacterium]